MDAKTWRKRELTRNRYDKRVQAIRCMSCHRLRAHPTKTRINCDACGAVGFEATFPDADEERIAFQLYEKEIESTNIYDSIAQEILDGWRVGGDPNDSPTRTRLYSK